MRHKKPWLAVLCRVERGPDGGTSCEEILWYSEKPILAYQPKEVERYVLVNALKDMTVEHDKIEVYVCPFGFPTD